MLSFLEWRTTLDRKPILLDTDLLWPTVRSAGSNGISVKELHQLFPKLGKEMPKLLQAWAEFGWIQWFVIDGMKYVRATC